MIYLDMKILSKFKKIFSAMREIAFIKKNNNKNLNIAQVNNFNLHEDKLGYIFRNCPTCQITDEIREEYMNVSNIIDDITFCITKKLSVEWSFKHKARKKKGQK